MGKSHLKWRFQWGNSVDIGFEWDLTLVNGGLNEKSKSKYRFE